MTTAIVTGSTRGIGRAIALELAWFGMDIVVNGRTRDDEAIVTVDEVRELGSEGIVAMGDVTDPAVAELIALAAVDSFGGIDVLVNNAGEYPRQKVDDLSIEDWQHTIEVNLSSAYYLSKACLPALRRAEWGRIVNISSVLAHMGSNQGAHYAAAKAGMIGLTKSLARELAPGITVNAVCPGMTMTDIMAVYSEEERAERADRIAMKRIGDPEDVAKAVAFLVTEARYTTGSVIDVNGGQLMR